MITLHHLNNSRSQRILWLLEELGLDHEIVRYERDTVTNLAPPELSAVHPLGKSPMVEMDGRLVVESGAIVELICARHAPQMVPESGHRRAYRASGMDAFRGRLGDDADPPRPLYQPVG